MENGTIINFKEKFFEESREFTEIKSTSESTTIGEFQDVDELEDEIWIMQCPKGTDVTPFQGQKLKLPGRAHVEDLEAVAVEFNAPITQSFGYCNRKGKYALRLLPIQGGLVLRNRLKAAATVTEKDIEDISPGIGRVPMPSGIKVRHPLLGVHFEKKINMDQAISERLRNADKNSARILGKTLFHTNNKVPNTKYSIPNTMFETVEIKSDPEDDFKFVTNNKNKKKKSKKRKNSESSSSSKKSKRRNEEIFYSHI